MRIPDTEHYDDGEVVFSQHFDNEGVGVLIATNLWEDTDETVPDFVPIRVRVTTEDGTGAAYLTAAETYELVQVLGNAITKAKQIEQERQSDG